MCLCMAPGAHNFFRLPLFSTPVLFIIFATILTARSAGPKWHLPKHHLLESLEIRFIFGKRENSRRIYQRFFFTRLHIDNYQCGMKFILSIFQTPDSLISAATTTPRIHTALVAMNALTSLRRRPIPSLACGRAGPMLHE